MKHNWTLIYWFEGDEVRSGEVLTSDLPRLSGLKTYWRESIPDAERATFLKEKIKSRMDKTP